MPVWVMDEDALGKTELTGCQGDNAWRHQGEHAGAYMVCGCLKITHCERSLPVAQVVGVDIGRVQVPIAWHKILQEFNGWAGGGP